MVVIGGGTKEPEMAFKTLPQLLPLVLKTCVVEPKICDKSDENCLGIDELDPMDAMQLFAEIMQFSGWTEVAEVQKFRAEKPSSFGSSKRRGVNRKKAK